MNSVCVLDTKQLQPMRKGQKEQGGKSKETRVDRVKAKMLTLLLLMQSMWLSDNVIHPPARICRDLPLKIVFSFPIPGLEGLHRIFFYLLAFD